MDNKQYIREGQKVTFSAQLEKGDRRLTSWIVYEGNQCDDNHIVKEEKQIGTEFSHIFEKAGEYTIVSYGKRDEINKSTATQVQVGKPVLEGIECVERANTYFKNNVYIVKKGTKVTFRLKFKDDVLPTSDKLLHLVKVIPIGGTSSGKIIREGKENEYSYNATNRSSYTVIVKFGNRTFEFSMRVVENFEEEVKKFEEFIAKDSSTEITTIPSGIENVRSKDSLKLKFNPKGGEPEINPSNLVWKLNGNTLLAKGTQIEIPREQIANCKKNNKVEVFKNNASTKSIASYNFSVVKNEIIKFDVSETPKFGKEVTFEVKEMTFSKLEANEEVYWEVRQGCNLVPPVAGFTFKHLFNKEGVFKVRCYISDVVVEKEYNIIQPKILANTAKWIDKDGASGNILNTAGYDQEVYVYVEHLGLGGEEVVVEVYNAKDKNTPIFTSKKITVPLDSKNFTFLYPIKKTYKGKTAEEKKKEDKERRDFQIFFKIKSIGTCVSPNEFEKNLLTITNRGDIVNAYFCDANDTKIYRGIEVGTVDLHFKLYMTNMLKREVEILFYILWDEYPTTPMKDCLNWVYWEKIAGHFSKKQPFHTAKAIVNNKGEILVEVPTLKLMQIDEYKSIVAVFKIMGSDGKEKGAYLESEKSLRLLPNYSLTHIEENFASIKVLKDLSIKVLNDLLKRGNQDVLRQEIGEEQSDKIIIRVNRIKTNSKRTISTLDVDNGAIKGYVLERDGKPREQEVIEESKKRIRAGEYNFEITFWSGKKKYINKSLRILNVPGRGGILFHWGNIETNSDGCLLGNPKEPLTSSSNSYEDSRKFVLEIVEYVRKRETEIKKEYNLKKVEKKIIITQSNEKEY